MDAKQTLIIALNALVEVKDALPKNTFVDLLMGKGNKEIEENGWDEAEAFGAGEGRDEEFWYNLLEKAIEAGYIKIKAVKSQSISITPAGKKYLKKPEPFEIKEEEEFSEDIKEDGIDDIVNSALKEKSQSAQKSVHASR